MGAVFSKKSGLNNLFVGCRTMSRDEVYGARENSRCSRRAKGDFCHFIENSIGSEWELTICINNNNNYWGSFGFSELMEGKSKETVRNIIRWRTEGK